MHEIVLRRMDQPKRHPNQQNDSEWERKWERWVLRTWTESVWGGSRHAEATRTWSEPRAPPAPPTPSAPPPLPAPPSSSSRWSSASPRRSISPSAAPPSPSPTAAETTPNRTRRRDSADSARARTDRTACTTPTPSAPSPSADMSAIWRRANSDRRWPSRVSWAVLCTWAFFLWSLRNECGSGRVTLLRNRYLRNSPNATPKEEKV